MPMLPNSLHDNDEASPLFFNLHLYSITSAAKKLLNYMESRHMALLGDILFYFLSFFFFEHKVEF